MVAVVHPVQLSVAVEAVQVALAAQDNDPCACPFPCLDSFLDAASDFSLHDLVPTELDTARSSKLFVMSTLIAVLLVLDKQYILPRLNHIGRRTTHFWP